MSDAMRLVQNIFLPNAAMIAAEATVAFSARRVDIQTTFTRSSLDQRAALLDGSADVAVTALDNLFDWNRSDDARFRAVAQIERTTSLPLYLAASLGSLTDLALLERPRLVVDSPSSGFGIALVAAVEGLGISRERLECRPPWREGFGTEWTRFPIVRLGYNQTRREWQIYWRDQNLKFHMFDRVAASPNVEHLLTEIDHDTTGIFWG